MLWFFFALESVTFESQATEKQCNLPAITMVFLLWFFFALESVTFESQATEKQCNSRPWNLPQISYATFKKGQSVHISFTFQFRAYTLIIVYHRPV